VDQENLKIKSFLGTSHKAVLTQIRIAMCVCLVLAYIKINPLFGFTGSTGIAVASTQYIYTVQPDSFALMRSV